MKETRRSDKKYSTAVILSFVFGIVGIHHFYLRRYAMGVFDFGMFMSAVILYYSSDFIALAIIIFAIDYLHTIIVTYKLLIGEFEDGNGKLVTYPGQKI